MAADNWAIVAAEVAEAIESNSIYEAAVNPANLNLPGYWVTPVRRTYDTLARDRCTVELAVYAIAGPLPDPTATLETLSDMQDSLMDVGDFMGWSLGHDGEISEVALRNKAPDNLPALKFETTLEVN